MCDCQRGYNAFSCSCPRAEGKMLSIFCLVVSYSWSCFLSLSFTRSGSLLENAGYFQRLCRSFKEDDFTLPVMSLSIFHKIERIQAWHLLLKLIQTLYHLGVCFFAFATFDFASRKHIFLWSKMIQNAWPLDTDTVPTLAIILTVSHTFTKLIVQRLWIPPFQARSHRTQNTHVRHKTLLPAEQPPPAFLQFSVKLSVGSRCQIMDGHLPLNQIQHHHLYAQWLHVLFFHSFGPRFAFFMMFSPLLGFNRSVCSHKVLSRKGGPAVVLPTIS